MERVSPDRAARVAVAWAAAEGWNPGVDDDRRFLAADHDAFIGFELDGEIAGTVSCTLYGPAYAFIGFYIVREDLRGRGIGSQLFDLALDRAEGRVVGLDAELEQEALYAGRGFVLADRNERWRGVGGGVRPPGLSDLDEVDYDELERYDDRVFGVPRRDFLRAWALERPHGQALVRFVDGAMRGYGILRACREGSKIGPLFADDPDTAAVLLAGLRAGAGDGTPIFLDAPRTNPDALALASAQLDAPVFETARMYRGGRPPEDSRRVFGLTTLEFG
jgi:GNAT superfamily N-acetyltransferase